MTRPPTWILVGAGLVVLWQAWRFWGPRPLGASDTPDPNVPAWLQSVSNVLGGAASVGGFDDAAGDAGTDDDDDQSDDGTEDLTEQPNSSVGDSDTDGEQFA